MSSQRDARGALSPPYMRVARFFVDECVFVREGDAEGLRDASPAREDVGDVEQVAEAEGDVHRAYRVVFESDP